MSLSCIPVSTFPLMFEFGPCVHFIGWQGALGFTFKACFTPAAMEKPKETAETYAPLFEPLLETPKGEIALIELAAKFVEYVLAVYRLWNRN